MQGTTQSLYTVIEYVLNCVDRLSALAQHNSYQTLLPTAELSTVMHNCYVPLQPGASAAITVIVVDYEEASEALCLLASPPCSTTSLL
jgi:hypothetical protein